MIRNSYIGLYRDVSIAAIASSRTSLATLTGVMCYTSQCELRSLRINSGMFNVIRIVMYYTLPPVRVTRLVLDCNGVFAIKAYMVFTCILYTSACVDLRVRHVTMLSGDCCHVIAIM